jgi:Rap1a immunity proteins
MLCRGVQLCRVLLTWHHRGPRSKVPGRVDTERSVAGRESIGRASGLALTLVCLGGPAPAAEPSVRDLYEDCRIADGLGVPVAWAPGEEARAVRCVSYLEGMANILNLNCMLARRGVMGGEVPAADIAGASPAGLVRAFLAWAERHPEEGDEHRSVAGIALVEAFPCR